MFILVHVHCMFICIKYYIRICNKCTCKFCVCTCTSTSTWCVYIHVCIILFNYGEYMVNVACDVAMAMCVWEGKSLLVGGRVGEEWLVVEKLEISKRYSNEI